jgi:hypothetical protein
MVNPLLHRAPVDPAAPGRLLVVPGLREHLSVSPPIALASASPRPSVRWAAPCHQGFVMSDPGPLGSV